MSGDDVEADVEASDDEAAALAALGEAVLALLFVVFVFVAAGIV